MAKERDLLRMIIREMLTEAVSSPGKPSQRLEKKPGEDSEEIVLAKIFELTGDIRIPSWLSTLIITVLIVSVVILFVVFGPEMLLSVALREKIAAFFVNWLLPGMTYAFRAYFAGRFGMLMGHIAFAISKDDEKKFWLGIAGILLLGIEVLLIEAFAISNWLKSVKGAKQLSDARALVEITDNGFREAAKMTGAMAVQGSLVSQINSNEDFIAEKLAIHLAGFFGRNTKNIFAPDYDAMIDSITGSEEELNRAEAAYRDAVLQAAKDIESASKFQQQPSNREEMENKYYEKTYDETR